jgi:hypothetical protein
LDEFSMRARGPTRAKSSTRSASASWISDRDARGERVAFIRYYTRTAHTARLSALSGSDGTTVF